MRPAAAPRPGRDLHVDVIVPAVPVRFGPFRFDPIAHVIGKPLAELLAPLLRAAPFERAEPERSVVVYPLAVPPGQHVALRLGRLGEFGLGSDDGLVVVAVPALAGALANPHLSEAVVRGPVYGPGFSDVSQIARFWLDLRNRARFTVPVGKLGSVGVEMSS